MGVLRKILIVVTVWCVIFSMEAQIPQPLKQFLRSKEMQGGSVSFLVKDLQTGEEIYSYDADKRLTPASVMKLVTTATALELLGEDNRFATSLEYTGDIKEGILDGDLYIKGGGDPTLGSAHFVDDRANYRYTKNGFMPEWIAAIREAGIRSITGSVIADERIFDTEAISPKWVREDLGSYYGAGSYGISVFDNILRIYLNTGKPGLKPVVIETEPTIPDLQFYNYLSSLKVPADSSYVLGVPYSNERYLYGIMPANRERYMLRGDIPDPPLFLAQYLTHSLIENGVEVAGQPSNFRLLSVSGKWSSEKRGSLTTTYSPPLLDILEIINHRSHNLFADAVLKTLGISYKPDPTERLSSFGKGVRIVEEFWKKKGLETSALSMYDGSGLAVSNKLTAEFLCDVLAYMGRYSRNSQLYIQTLPRVGQDGSVRNFLKGTSLQGRARLKSGSMGGVKAYAGYITKGERTYTVALIVNNYTGEGSAVTREIERLLVALF